MWQVTKNTDNNTESGANEGTSNLSSGVGLALLSKALGVQKIEDKY